MLKFLVADDHVVIRQIVEQHLRGMGYQNIDSVATSEEVDAKMKANKYDVVLLDWYMPGKGGFALMKEYREDRAFDNVAFVMITAESHEKSVIEALKAGATAYIIKPITKAGFEEKIGKAVRWLESRANAKQQSEKR